MQTPLIPIRGGEIDLDGARVVKDGAAVGLTPIEERLLRYLAGASGRLCSREELMVEVWGYHPSVRSRTIDNAVRRLREKIEIDPGEPVHLQTVYGRGLRLVSTGTKPIETALAGRLPLLEEAQAAFDTGAQLLSLIGPPGVGKTSLAREIARLQESGRTVVWVALDGADPERWLAQIGVVLGGVPADPERIGAALAGHGPLMLALDGFEHREETLSAALPGWIARARSLRVVVTGRLPLGLPGERVLPVEPLGEDDAVALLLERARRAGPPLEDSDELRALVRSLDGLPLAIDLAAARVALIGPARLQERIARGVRLQDLLDGAVLRSTVDASLRELDERELQTLASLALFDGPFSLDDAEAIADDLAVIGPLQRLVERSLVRVLAGSDEAFALYGVVRDRVRELHPATPEGVLRHGAWFGRLASFVPGAARIALQRAAAVECRAAMERLWTPSPELAGRCGAALMTVLAVDGPHRAAFALADRLLALPLPAEVEATIRRHLADTHLGRAQIPQALAHIERALSLPIGPDERALLLFASVRAHQGVGQLDEAQVTLERVESEGLSAAMLGRRELHAGNLLLLRGEWAESEAALLRGRAQARLVEDALLESYCADRLSLAVAMQGRLAEAAALARESLARPTSRLNEAWCSFQLAQVELLRGGLAAASDAIARAESLFRSLGSDREERLVGGLRAVAMARGGDAENAEALMLSLLNRGPLHAADTKAWERLVEIRVLLDRIEDARQALQMATSLSDQIGVRSTLADLVVWRALFLAHDGDIEGARQEAARIEDALSRLSRVRHQAICAFIEARYGDRQTAAELLDQVHAAVDELGLGPSSEAMIWSRRARDEIRRLRLATG